jgi:hypothetical protein
MNTDKAGEKSRATDYHRRHRGTAEKNLRKIEAFTAETLRTQRKPLV